MRVFFIVLIVTLLGCSNKEKVPLLDCDLNQYLDSDLMEFNAGIKLRVPIAWDSEIIKNGDDSFSEVCLDTLLLFDEEIVRSITVTKFPFKRTKYNENLENELNLIRQKEGATLIDYGYQSINNLIFDWIYFNDNSIHSLIFYLRDEEFITIDFSVSQHVLYKERLCEIIGFIETIEHSN